MEILQYTVGFLVCIGPLGVLVAYLMWASRRRHCPHCRRAVHSGDAVCGHCGQSLTEEQPSKDKTGNGRNRGQQR